MKALVYFLIGFGLTIFTMKSLAGGGGGAAHRDNTALFPPKAPVKSLTEPPEKSELLEPPAFASVPGPAVTLKWKPADKADSYHIQLATDPNFKWLVQDLQLYKDTSFEAKDLVSGQRYYWRVAGLRPGNDPGYAKGYFVKSTFIVK